MNIGTPPLNDGWILAYDPDLHDSFRTSPWVIATRGDEGFFDSDGYPVEPRGWAPLPDPQPAGTGWTPPKGTVAISRARIFENGWYGWTVFIKREDGSDDPREPWLFDLEAEADAKAAQMARLYDLPITKDPTAVPDEDCNVIPFDPQGGGARER
nr:hypothetical protein [Novosphingobium panipatense]